MKILRKTIRGQYHPNTHRILRNYEELINEALKNSNGSLPVEIGWLDSPDFEEMATVPPNRVAGFVTKIHDVYYDFNPSELGTKLFGDFSKTKIGTCFIFKDSDKNQYEYAEKLAKLYIITDDENVSDVFI